MRKTVVAGIAIIIVIAIIVVACIAIVNNKNSSEESDLEMLSCDDPDLVRTPMWIVQADGSRVENPNWEKAMKKVDRCLFEETKKVADSF